MTNSFCYDIIIGIAEVNKMAGKKKVGRPTKLTQDVKNRLLHAASFTQKKKTIAGYAGIHVDTLLDWLNADTEFSREFDMAFTTREVTALQELYEKSPLQWLNRASSDYPHVDKAIPRKVDVSVSSTPDVDLSYSDDEKKEITGIIEGLNINED